MNKIVKRLRSKVGESLIESMAAILIFTLASIMMYTMIMAANDINLRAGEMETRNMEQVVIAEMAEDDATERNVIFVVNGGDGNGGTTVAVDVDVYGDQTSIYAYYPKEG